MKRTEQQQRTIRAPLGNILVSAAAGSGKTSVMTERIVSRILTGQLDMRNVLVMTFTDAAAKNMRDKIGQQLRDALSGEQIALFSKESKRTPAIRQSYLQKQIAYLEQSAISTIHAFCLDVIRNFYYEATDASGKVILEPGFRIEEQGEAKIFLERTLDDLFERYYVQCDREPDTASTRDFLFLIDAYGSTRDDAPVKELLLSIYPFLRSMPDYEEWICRQKDLLDRTIRDFDRSPCRKVLHEGLLLRAGKAGEGLGKLREFILGKPLFYKDERKNDAKNRAASEDLNGVCHFIDDAIKIIGRPDVKWDELYDYFQNMPSIPSVRHHPAETTEKAEWIELFEQYFAEFLHYTTGEFGTPKYEARFQFGKCYIFDRTKDEITRELAAMQPAIDRLLNILLDLDREYAGAKREANMIDFADFEHFALKILKVPLVKQYYMDKFKEIYVDEYQDTSSIQEAILERISNSNCFMVGDVKQSIYKFRHARPQIFMGKYASFLGDNGMTPDSAYIETGNPGNGTGGNDAGRLECGTVFELNQNFRSVKGILSAVNDVFYQIMSDDAGEIDYNEEQSLVPHREDAPDVPAPVEIFLVDLSEEKIGSQEAISVTSLQQEVTAGGDPDAEILLEAGVEGASDADAEPVEESPEEEGSPDGSGKTGEKPEENSISKEEATRYQKEAAAVALRIKELLEHGHKPKDIAVLSRTRTICGVFAEAIGLLGIPVEQEQKEAFLDRYELKVMESLLVILDNPMQDIPLASVMRAPLFENGFCEEELLAIRVQNPALFYFYECCESYTGDGSDPVLKEKLRRFYQWISHLRDGLAYQTVGELIETIYAETEFLAAAAKMPDGLQRVISLQQFQDWAGGYDRSRRSGLYSFVRYMEAFHEKSQDQSPFGIEQSQSDSVKVMTIHKSKGLEYEIVFLVGNNRRMISRDTRDPILVSEEFGIGFQYVDVKRQFRYPTPLVFAMREGMRNAELAEEMRLLYVGMTRAMGRIFITGTCNNADHRNGKGLAALIGKAREYPCDSPLPPHVALSVKSTLEWIVLAIARNPHIDFEPLAISSYKPEVESDAKTGGKVCSYSDSWGLRIENDRVVRRKIQKLLESRTVPVDISEIIQEGADYVYSDDLPGEFSGAWSDEALKERCRSQFLQDYAYNKATHSPLKITVSEIKRREQEQMQDGLPVRFPISSAITPLRSINTTMEALNRGAETTLSRSDIGIAVHSFFRFMDLGLVMGSPDRRTIEAQMALMLEAGMVQKREHDCLAGYIGAFEGFLRSGLAARIFTSYKTSPSSVFREIPFTLKMDARTFFGAQGFADGDTIFVQGMIDCWFVENGEAVLVDYKTDRISGDDEQIKRALAERYRSQLSIYAQAIAKTSGLKVKQCILWLVDNKKEFIIELSENFTEF